MNAELEEGVKCPLEEAVIELDAAERAIRAAKEKELHKVSLRVARVLSKLPTLTEQGWVLDKVNAAFDHAVKKLSEPEPKTEEVAA